jgi:hypothetical protein
LSKRVSGDTNRSRWERLEIHHGAARGVEQRGTRLHPGQLPGGDHAASLRRVGHVQRDDVGAFQQRVERAHRPGVAERQLGDDVVVDHLHAQRFGEHAHLGADVAVADDAQHLAAGLVGAGGGLPPFAAVRGGVLGRDAAQQQHHLGHHQFGDAARIRERRVEHRDAALLGCRQIHLVGADAEAAHGDQAWRLLEHPGGQLGPRADAEDVRIGESRQQALLGQSLVVGLDACVSVRAEHRGGAGVDAFEQQDLDAVLAERGARASGGSHAPHDARVR